MRHIIVIVITIACKGCVSISRRHLLPGCHHTYIQSKRCYYYLRPHGNVAMQLCPRMKSTSLKWTHYQLGFAKLMFGKGNVAGWCKGIDTSNEVACNWRTRGRFWFQYHHVIWMSNKTIWWSMHTILQKCCLGFLEGNWLVIL